MVGSLRPTGKTLCPPHKPDREFNVMEYIQPEFTREELMGGYDEAGADQFDPENAFDVEPVNPIPVGRRGQSLEETINEASGSRNYIPPGEQDDMIVRVPKVPPRYSYHELLELRRRVIRNGDWYQPGFIKLYWEDREPWHSNAVRYQVEVWRIWDLLKKKHEGWPTPPGGQRTRVVESLRIASRQAGRLSYCGAAVCTDCEKIPANEKKDPIFRCDVDVTDPFMPCLRCRVICKAATCSFSPLAKGSEYATLPARFVDTVSRSLEVTDAMMSIAPHASSRVVAAATDVVPHMQPARSNYQSLGPVYRRTSSALSTLPTTSASSSLAITSPPGPIILQHLPPFQPMYHLPPSFTTGSHLPPHPFPSTFPPAYGPQPQRWAGPQVGAPYPTPYPYPAPPPLNISTYIPPPDSTYNAQVYGPVAWMGPYGRQPGAFGNGPPNQFGPPGL